MAETQPNPGRPPEATEDRGVLKIFLGYAPGVGKTFGMLEEAHRRKRRGQDVVVGVIESHGRREVLEEQGDLEVIPLATNGELDLRAVLSRNPGVILIDELEHTNAKGSTHEKRWQDVQELLAAGVSVLTTCNVSSLESLKDQVQDITGVQISETLPDQVLHSADEIELVDLTPRALINRLERGDILDIDQVPEARKGLFREGNLAALREIAMREAAGRVDEDVTRYRQVKGIERPWATSDRVMICVSPNRGSLRLIRKGWRIGQRLHGQVVAVHVEEKGMTEVERSILRDDFALAERLGVRTVVLRGEIGPTLIQFAKDNNVTQIVMGHPERTKIQELMHKSIINELIRSLRTVDITLIAADKPKEAAH